MANNFFLIFLNESFWYVRFCAVWFSGRTNFSLSRQMINDCRKNEIYYLPAFFWQQNVSFLLRSCSFQRKQPNFALNFCHVMYFIVLQVSFEQLYHSFAKKPDKLFWTGLKGTTFALAGEIIGTLENRNDFVYSSFNDFKFFKRCGWKYLMRLNHCLNNNVIYRLYAATNQTIKNSREPTLRLDTSQVALIQDPSVDWAYWLASHHGEIWREQCV